MIIQTELERKRTDFRTEACSIDKVVELSPSEFAEFVHTPLHDHDFIREFNKEHHERTANTRSCLLIFSEHEKDGILIDPQGYNYARYSAYIPNARNLVNQEQYPSLNAFTGEMRWIVDKYTQKAVDGQIDCQYSIDLNAIEQQCRHAGFSEELFMDMLSDRPEIENVEAIDGYGIVTIAEPYLRQEDEQNLRKLTPEEIEIMCAKHILWLHDAGGEQADFSNCLLADLDLSRKNLMNAVFNGAKLSNVNLGSAELCFSVLSDAKIYNCYLTDVIAEETEFNNAEFIGSDFDRSIFTHSDFTDAKFRDCSINNGSLQNCCLDGTEFGDMYLGSTNTNGCCYDKQDWSAEWDGSITINGGNA
ncbi:MAG: pentapeptide repeat-containing protein [Eubacteriales bacterium]|nr:pentapeptide repeat-containing protein [Eubacteriales bacterium]